MSDIPPSPEVHREYLRLLSAQEARYRDWINARVSPTFHERPYPEPERLMPDALQAQARANCIERAAWRKTPHGRYVTAIEAVLEANDQIRMEVERARSAQSRSWLGELRYCDARAVEIERLTVRLRQGTLDAQVAVQDECERDRPK